LFYIFWMFSQSVAGDGGCLFTSLSISLKCKRLLESPKCINIFNDVKLNQKNLSFLLKDSSQNGFQIRQAIIHWYIVHMEDDIQELGDLYVKPTESKSMEHELKKDINNKFKAKDVLVLELARHADVPENEKKKMLLVLNYLKHMTLFHSWGSTPEYIAFSLLFKYPIKIWRLEEDKLVLNDQFPTDTLSDDSCINLLFINGNHYEPLITKEERKKLVELYNGTLEDFPNQHTFKNI